MEQSVTVQNIKRFKKEYYKALRDGQKSFMFDDAEVLVVYAKYVIQYFDKIKL